MSGANLSVEKLYKAKYRVLKKKIKYLVYENEGFHRQLEHQKNKLSHLNSQKLSLLDRLAKHERITEPAPNSSDEEAAAVQKKVKETKSQRPRLDFKDILLETTSAPQTQRKPQQTQFIPQTSSSLLSLTDGHMTPEEVERHLESRRSSYIMDLQLPGRTPLTVPNEMFSHEAESQDSDNEQLVEEDASLNDIEVEYCFE